MKFLLASGGIVDNRFAGIMTSPAHKGIPLGIIEGMSWAAENEAFTRGFDPERFFPWLETMEPYKKQCLFVPVPDEVGNAIQTLANFRAWLPRFIGWPLAFVAQDGQELLGFPHPSTWATLFIGGSTEWKESVAAIECIKRAQALNKQIHIGRVNWGRRYDLFIQISGSDSFTCDGTRHRFEGIEQTAEAWVEYQNRMALPLW